MFSISNNGIIRLTRGDCFSVPLFINRGTELNPIRYYIANDYGEETAVYLGVMEPNQKFEEAIIRKKYTKDNINEHGDIVIEFDSDDTVNLLPGLYYYTVKINKYNSDTHEYEVNTVIQKTQFFIEE